jgi:hypothetical protein
MSGDDNRSSKPGTAPGPFFDEADAPRRARARRTKPPPGIITAGGVDMARAHASGIKIRAGAVPDHPIDEPRVVIAVETDARRTTTHKRILDTREPEEDGARSALLPGTPGLAGGHPQTPGDPGPGAAGRIAERAPDERTPRAAPEPGIALPPPPPAKPRAHPLPVWMRVAMALAALLLVAGLVRRVRTMSSGPESLAPPPSAPPPAALPLPTGAVAPPTVPARAPEPAASPAETVKPAPAPPRPAPVGAPDASTRPQRSPPAAPATSKPAFVPPFQLPGEKD